MAGSSKNAKRRAPLDAEEGGGKRRRLSGEMEYAQVASEVASRQTAESLKRPAPRDAEESVYKRRRLTGKQEKYAFVASKYPEVAYGRAGATRENELAQTKRWWESTAEDVQPRRLEPDSWAEGQLRPTALQLCDLECTRKLGSGGYGMVLAVRVRPRKRAHTMDEEGGQMALKVLHKRRYREAEPDDERDFQDRLHDEKNVERANLRAIPWHPFVAGLYDGLADTRNLYLLQELGACGTLGQYVRARGALPASVCRFFFANVVLAVEYVQSLGLVHGDVKPDNFFVGADGYLMLGDFGLSSRWDEERRWECIGTLTYMSPEFLQKRIGEDDKRALDWWSVGCILYEMAVGKMAFRAKKGSPMGGDSDECEHELTKRVMRGQYFWPKNVDVDPDLKALVDKMLCYDTSTRCVSWPVDAQGKKVPAARQIKKQRFLHGFPWRDMEDRTLLAPSVPKAIPDLSMGWHHRQMPLQAKVPGLPRVIPPPYLEWDRRFMSQREQAWHKRQKEARENERQQKGAADAEP